MARQIILDQSGHTTIQFDASNSKDSVVAERRFNKLVSKGYIPAERRGEGEHYVPHERDRKFNPEAEETIFIPALKGG